MGYNVDLDPDLNDNIAQWYKQRKKVNKFVLLTNIHSFDVSVADPQLICLDPDLTFSVPGLTLNEKERTKCHSRPFPFPYA
jgi:hypothetical protein